MGSARIGDLAAQANRRWTCRSPLLGAWVHSTGDSIITRPLSAQTDPGFLKLIELIRAQDAAFTNLEINLSICRLAYDRDRTD